MAYKDLRGWLTEVEKLGQLKKVDGASWDLEMGAITELIYKMGKGTPPAVIFDKVPGYPEGFRTIFGMTCSVERMALTLNLPPAKTGVELVKSYRDKLKDFKKNPLEVMDFFIKFIYSAHWAWSMINDKKPEISEKALWYSVDVDMGLFTEIMNKGLKHFEKEKGKNAKTPDPV